MSGQSDHMGKTKKRKKNKKNSKVDISESGNERKKDFKVYISEGRDEGKKDFKVYINEGERKRIEEWVKLKPDIETGGDLFGLWLDNDTAVVQFALGPGEGCSRTETSFFQDTDYLERTGNFFTRQHGLCNIGQWHSHHKLALSEPSNGDHNTVWSNMPLTGIAIYLSISSMLTHAIL